MKEIKQIVEILWGFFLKWLTKNEAFDEIIEDSRDYELIGGKTKGLPKSFRYKPYEVTDQRKDGYRMSCTAQSVSGAGNTGYKYKKGKAFFSPFVLWDNMIENNLGDRKRGAYLRDAVLRALKDKMVKGFYRTRTVEAIKEALYKTDLVVTGSTKINWKKLIETGNVVRSVGRGYGHAFYIIGWNNIGFICQNSYGKDFVLNEFIIPFDLVDKVLFNSTYAINVNPEWNKLTKEQLFKKYQLKQK